MKTLPVAVYVRGEDGSYNRQETWPLPYMLVLRMWFAVIIEVEEAKTGEPFVTALFNENGLKIIITFPTFRKQDEDDDPQQAWRPVLNPPPAHRYIERCCETCKFRRDTDFQHWVICAGPARDMICQGHVTRRDAPPILVEKRFCCKFYEGQTTISHKGETP